MSAVRPVYMRKSPKVTGVLPLLYLRGLSAGDLAPTRAQFFRSEAGLSASTVQRLTEPSQPSTRNGTGATSPAPVTCTGRWTACTSTSAWRRTDCAAWWWSVAAPTAPRGWSHWPTATKEPWAAVLRSLRDRGLANPVLAVGDGALGFWAAIREVPPSTKQQRSWAHETASVLDALPKRLQPQAK